ncbi:MAG TPA: methylmalonyl-CoA mutase family protein, partial [Candidatus Elarobacter sp.]|nr:methylmalonyl-CoA mutase family protein [Candidatus Elarobacter sp.]
GGSTLTAQEPENNVVRVSLQALAAVLGGTQSLHTNGQDEALGLPTEQSARVALRTQQIIAYESGVTDVVDPLAGSYYVERLTDELTERARGLIGEIDALGGAVAAIESGWMQDQIGESAYRAQQAVESSRSVIVGVNRFNDGRDGVTMPIQRIDPAIEAEQIARTRAVRARRDAARTAAVLDDVRRAAEGAANLMPPFVEAVDAGATLGEICDVLRGVFGRYVAHERIA